MNQKFFLAENVRLQNGPPNEIDKPTKSDKYSKSAHWWLVLAAKGKHRGTKAFKCFEITVGFRR